MNHLFFKYASQAFYNKFVEGGLKLNPDIKKEWKEVYMEGVGLVPMPEFLEWVDSLELSYEKTFKNRKDYIHFSRFKAYILPITAPKFSEQFDEELKANITRIV